MSVRWMLAGCLSLALVQGVAAGDGVISDELSQAVEPVGRALAARRFTSPFGPAPTAQDNSPEAIAYYLSKGLDGKLADAKVLTNDSSDEETDVWLGDRMFRLPPKGWVAVSADGRAGSMNVRLNRQRFMAGWCDDYTVWVKDGKIGLRNLNLTRGVVVRADGDPTRPRKLGEESAFAVEVRDEAGNLRTDGTVTVFADNCGAKKLLGETRFDLAAGNPFTVRAKMDEPGFLRLTARLEKPAKSATATVPYAPEGIRPGTARPDDFDAVWAADLRRADETVPLDPRREEVTGAYGGALKEYSVSFATTEGRRVYGYMAVPKAASASNKMGVVVTIVGAGPGASYAWDARDDSITLVLNVVDYLPTEADVGRDYAAMNARAKKRFGVDGYSQAGWTAKREEVFFHSQLIGLVRGLKWIAQLPEVDASDFTYFGGSQGGGCGMAVVALSDGLFRKAFLYITAMSDMLRADVGGRDGWPGVRRHASDADALAAVKRNAPYFDACSFARRVRCPVRSTLGLEDTTCPPPNVMASFNELASKDRKIDFEPRIGHGISGLRFASIYEWLRAKDDANCTTKLMFSFDTEDFTNPRSADAILRVAELFESEGLVGHFQVVGQLARQLENWGRQDVIKALSRHLIGTHTLNHSIHPNMLELSDGEDYAAAYGRVMAQESECVATLKRVFKTDRIWSSSPSGTCESYVADRVYADLGIDYGVGPHYTTMDGDDIWFAGLRRIAYVYSWDEFFYQGPNFDRSAKNLLDKLAKSHVGMVFLHPNFAYSKTFWDRLNYNGGNYARWGEWKLSPPRDKETVDEYFDWIRQMLRAIKADPRFELTTIPELDCARKPRRPIRRDDLARIRECLRKDFTTIREPASWCVSDVFVAVVKMLRGEGEYLPGAAYGFLSRPVGVASRTEVSRADLVQAAKAMDVSGFLPASVRVGSAVIGPADFLFAGLDVLVDGAETAVIVPREQLGRFKGTPLEPLEHRVRVKIPGDPRSGWMHTAAFRDEFTGPRLRWQLWTFRYE